MAAEFGHLIIDNSGAVCFADVEDASLLSFQNALL